ncbi:MAG: hypothetical protein E7363_01105 [Clostridiales bacterium]|nr:hypothetical protein [Clostridiales bacterium]
MNLEKEKTQKRVKALATFLARGKKEGKNLSELFSEYAKKTGKAKGSIRNLYYESVAKTEGSPHLKTRLFGKEDFSVQKKKTFSQTEEEGLLLRLFTLKRKGVSVRSALAVMAEHSPSLALRYQNKYRNLLTKNPSLVLRAVARVKEETGYCFNPYEGKKKAEISPVKQRKESALAKKLNRLKKENARLKEKLSLAESKVTQTALALFPAPTNVPTLSPTQTEKQA